MASFLRGTRGRLRLVGAVALIGSLGVAERAAACAPGFQDAGGGVCTATLVYTGAPETLTLPPGVSAITAVVSGAEGGTSLEEQVDPFGGLPSPGGKGGREMAIVPVAPGGMLTVVVGQAGTGGMLAPPGFGGYGGGGHATSRYGGNGGGGSFVFDDNGVLVAAGGGGGGGYDYNPVARQRGDQQAPGGDGSGASPASDGQSVGFCCDTTFPPPQHNPPGGGHGATPTSAGLGGQPNLPPGYAFGQVDGDPGSGPTIDANNFGNGGNTHNGCCYFVGWAAGGGGGYFGGGGGGNIEADLEGGGGGGGAGYVVPAAISSSSEVGVQLGDGEVTISYYTGACNPTCATCSGPTPSECTSCASGLSLANGLCVAGGTTTTSTITSTTVVSSTTTSTTVPGSTTTTTIPAPDHYVCYKAALARGEPKLAPSTRSLVDQLETKQYDAKVNVALCNPATKIFGPLNESPRFPAVHLEGYKLGLTKTLPPQAKFVPGRHVVRDQFNTLTLTVKSVDTLLVRAAKSDLGTTFPRCSKRVPCAGGTVCSGGVCIDPAFPAAPPDQVGVDNFKCYKVAVASRTPKFVPITGGRVQLTDEFGGPLAYDVLKPTHLCTPVDKASENPAAETHAGHLTCYRVKPTAPASFAPHEVAAANTNFPDARLVAKSVTELCVPAVKDPAPGQ
jgi:hypothetical protein